MNLNITSVGLSFEDYFAEEFLFNPDGSERQKKAVVVG